MLVCALAHESAPSRATRMYAHADRAACVRACMNARSSISDAYKCAPSVSRPRVLSHDKTLSEARAYAFGSYRVPSRLHCPLELYCFLMISTPPLSLSLHLILVCVPPSASLFFVDNIKRLSNTVVYGISEIFLESVRVSCRVLTFKFVFLW